MASVNYVLILGNVGADPVVRDIGQGTKAAQFSVATSERYKDRQGEYQEKTEWHNIVAFRGFADIAEKYLRKGTQVSIQGKLRTRAWTDTNGIKRYTTEIVANDIQRVGQTRESVTLTGARILQEHNRQMQQQPAAGQPAISGQPQALDISEIDDGDLPF